MPESGFRYRWFQFSLRMMFLIVIAGNVFWWTNRTLHQAKTESDSLKIQLAILKEENLDLRAKLTRLLQPRMAPYQRPMVYRLPQCISLCLLHQSDRICTTQQPLLTWCIDRSAIGATSEQ